MMTIDDLKSSKKQLMSDIMVLIHDFHKSTGIHVSNVEVVSDGIYELTRENYNNRKLISMNYDIEIELDLDD